MCTLERIPYFSDIPRGESVRTQLLDTANDRDVDIIAYCFMPDHLHLLVEGQSEQANARKFAEVFRQVSGFYFRAHREARLWQEGYYDHILRDEDATIAVARYIVLNPVRAGLCADASTYPLTGSTRYELAQLLTAAEWYPPSRR